MFVFVFVRSPAPIKKLLMLHRIVMIVVQVVFASEFESGMCPADDPSASLSCSAAPLRSRPALPSGFALSILVMPLSALPEVRFVVCLGPRSETCDVVGESLHLRMSRRCHPHPPHSEEVEGLSMLCLRLRGSSLRLFRVEDRGG